MLITRKFGVTLLLLLGAIGGSALAQEGPAWPPDEAPVAMPQGQPAAAPRESIIEAGELLTGRGQELHNTRILVKDGKIIAVGPHLTAPGAVIYDLRKGTVMPGLIDVHVHLLRHFGPNDKADDPAETQTQFALGVVNNLWVTLMAGFTTVQSVGDPQDEVYRKYVEQGIVPGPRILTSYHDIYGSPQVGDDDVLRAKVDLLKYEHADLVKIFASDSIRDGGNEILTLHQLQVLCGEANRIGMRTLVHAYNGSVHNAIAAGCTEVEHGTGATQADIDLMAKKGTYFDPQVGLVVQNYIRFQKKFSGSGDYDAAGFQRMQAAIKTEGLLFNAARKAGVKQVMGTDAVAGGFGHQEDEIIGRIKLGQSAMNAIDDATSVNAESLRLDKQTGTVAAGYDADIIAVDGDPLTEAARLRQVSFVMKGGTVYKDAVSGARK
jgi:imidazolonepropionase-like amidohydrolase